VVLEISRNFLSPELGFLPPSSTTVSAAGCSVTLPSCRNGFSRWLLRMSHFNPYVVASDQRLVRGTALLLRLLKVHELLRCCRTQKRWSVRRYCCSRIIFHSFELRGLQGYYDILKVFLLVFLEL